MQAVTQESYGSADVLHMGNVPVPEPKANEVLIQVSAAGVDRGVWHMMTGLPYLGRLAFGLRKPRNPVPGMDLAGTVSAVGSAVTRFAVGDQVYGSGRSTYAEYAVAPEARLAAKPAGLTFAQAAAVPVSAVTALQGLGKTGRVQAGQKVLVIGASGGVGSYAVQLAKAFGTEVTGVCSTGKMDFVRSMGADEVIDYTAEDFADGTRHWDLILDIAGNPSIARLRRALTPKGTAVITGGEAAGNLTGGMNRQLGALALSPFVPQRLTMFIGAVRSAELEDLTGLIDAGSITPPLERTFPLDQAPEALDWLASGKVRGKIALAVG
ncbi:NAD(P)-dependent alcohol dehydrogenase [Arthrobacter sp. Sa2BUA2]|uniref:NAD(P)-dependent alcohol dehydrogenase n=1 Tax=Arthrobacter pullicola TaxID=2762224 RepID=A0ABR8YLC0_9MICC|nr:NAD(P)-dependent alcohol dehydrogenase [Arthrobacter pullicola]MBD8044679.1 NAD(P)-dependent alcohol dehydrogenase [Arthrobacter pullicola]